jgi:hypothetical protein
MDINGNKTLSIQRIFHIFYSRFRYQLVVVVVHVDGVSVSL